MLGNADAYATIGVKDLKNAAAFYEGKVGLKKQPSSEEMVLLYSSGASKILVYQSQFAGTNQATAVTWVVDDVDAEVRALKEKGVKFERYNFPDVKLEGDVHVSGSRRNAWFKDPDGNVLAIVSK